MSSSGLNCECKNIHMLPIKKRSKRTYLSVSEKDIVLNIYKKQLKANPEKPVADIVKITALIAGVCERSVYRIRREDMAGGISSPKRTKNRQKIHEKLEDFDKNAIRRIIHEFFHRNELPTIKKVLEVVNADPSLPHFKKSSFHKLLKKLNFKFVRRGRDCFLNDRDDIVVWRRDYLRKLRQFRESNCRIYYLDETWITAEHTKNSVWKDLAVTSSQAAFSSGLKDPSGKGKRLIITHIGSDTGFVNGALWILESEKTNKYHEEMNPAKFEEWFKKVLQEIEENAVIVMDNALCHSRKLNGIPNTDWKKAEIQDWLQYQGIPFTQDMIKIELLHIVKRQRIPDTYAVDEMAKSKNITVLRLPPYHCELNPIEMIWAQIKNYVAEKNTTLNIADMKNLFEEAVNRITTEHWKKCIDLVVNTVENKFWQLDNKIETTMEPLIIKSNDSDSSSELYTDRELNSE